MQGGEDFYGEKTVQTRIGTSFLIEVGEALQRAHVAQIGTEENIEAEDRL